MTSVLLGTASGLYRVGDGAVETTELADRTINALARDQQGHWAIAGDHELLRDPGDGSWQPVSTLRVLRATCVRPTPAGLLVGTSEAHLLRLTGDRLIAVDSFDQAAGRDTWYTPWGGPPDTRSIAVASDGRMYVNVHVGGILSAPDPDAVWQPTIEIDTDVHQVHAPDGMRVLAATARGLAVSDDAGNSWTFFTEGLDGRYLRAVATTSDAVVVTGSTGPAGRRAAVYRGDVASIGPLQRCRDGLPEWFSDNIDTACLDASGSTVAFGTADGDCYLSVDDGRSWTRVASDLPPVRCLTLVS